LRPSYSFVLEAKEGNRNASYLSILRDFGIPVFKGILGSMIISRRNPRGTKRLCPGLRLYCANTCFEPTGGTRYVSGLGGRFTYSLVCGSSSYTSRSVSCAISRLSHRKRNQLNNPSSLHPLCSALPSTFVHTVC
jgi:hypothetical protein